jgi:hypothetical protein
LRRVIQVALPIAIFVLALFLFTRSQATSSNEPLLTGGDGSSCTQAIVIRGARNEVDGVAAEYKWLAEKYPRSRLGNQTLQHDGGRSFDLIELTTASGESKTVCFDISEFYSKL